VNGADQYNGSEDGNLVILVDHFLNTDYQNFSTGRITIVDVTELQPGDITG
jgi:hypothetical protein